MIGYNPLKDSGLRESQFEFIRILAQFFIVLYHLFMLYVYPATGNPLHKAIWLPLHIGVPLFVLISGYFGIRTTAKGFIKLVGMVFVLYVPIEVIDLLTSEVIEKRKILTTICFLFGSHFWFIRTYVYLYLFAPIINTYLKAITPLKRLYLIFVLGIIAVYVGTSGFDGSVGDGKNLINFLFWYVIGNTLHQYRATWVKWPYKILILSYVIYNLCLVVTFTEVWDKVRGVEIFFNRIFFSYASIGLLINAILFFIIIGKWKFRSGFVNHVAKSSLAIYLLHASYLLRDTFIAPYVKYFTISYQNDQLILFGGLIGISIIIIIACILIDNLLSPVWSIINRLGNKCQLKVDYYIKTNFRLKYY